MSPDEHELRWVRQVKLGGSPVKGFPALYGTQVRCVCGWHGQLNGKKPTDGGRAWAEEKHTQHRINSIYREPT